MVKEEEVRRISIQVTTTDGDPSTWPDTNLRVRNGDYAFFFYEVDEDSSVYKQWMETLGDVISDIEDTYESFVLQGFPPGFKLFFYAKIPASSQVVRETLPMAAIHNTLNNGFVERTDIYLYGLGRRFRSKNEFIPHFRWLYSGKAGRCECKYCNMRPRRYKHQPKLYITRSSNVSSWNHKEVKIEDDSAQDRETLSRLTGPIYRPKEIVWVVGPNQNLMLPTSDESSNGRDIKEYYNWPGYVVDIYEEGERSSDYLYVRETIYEVRLLALDRTRYYPESSLAPWIVRDATPAITSFSLVDELFNQAINIATAYQRSFVMNKEYKFRISEEVITSTKDKDQRKRLRNAKKCPHYYEMMFGTEVIRTNDLVRLTVEEDETNSILSTMSSKSHDMEFFRVATMYRLANDQIQFTGDLYVRVDESEDIVDILEELDMSENDERLQRMLTIGRYKYIPRNFPREEYTVDMEDLAGRFYTDWEELTGLMNLTEEKRSRDINDYSMQTQKRATSTPTPTPTLQFENYEDYDDYDSYSDSQMSDIESLSTDSFFDINRSFTSAIDIDITEKKETQLLIYEPEQHETIFSALHHERCQV